MLAVDGVDALLPALLVDDAAKEVVLARGCGKGSAAIRWLDAALVRGVLLAPGGEVLRGIGVSAAVRDSDDCPPWGRGFACWQNPKCGGGGRVGGSVRVPSGGSCALRGCVRDDGRRVQLRLVLLPGPPGREPPAKEMLLCWRPGSSLACALPVGKAPR